MHRPPHRGAKRFTLTLLLFAGVASGQEIPKQYDAVCDTLLKRGFSGDGSYSLLRELTGKAPHRLAGSDGAAKAVELTTNMMTRLGFANVRVETCMVPYWERGALESAEVLQAKGTIRLSVCALGGSIATPVKGITAEVVEVKSFDELQNLGGGVKGKIVFFNRPIDPSKLNTFEGYSGAVDQRASGAVMASKMGGVAALVRSVTTLPDDAPHTGGMGYQDTVARVPGAALSAVAADRLSGLLKRNPHLRLRLRLSCRTLPDVPSANVVGEITGAEKPKEIIVVGGHLDCWDKGSGAHDDASGCVQAIEVVDLIRKVGLHPKRTIRAVMFMNEENGLRGGQAYRDVRSLRS